MTDARREDYWETVEQDAQTVADLLLAESGEWTLHGVALSGQEPERDLLHLLCVRSRLGDSGLLLAVGYVSVDTETAEVRWSGDNTCMMRVSGPVTQALLRLIARADNEGLAGEQQEPLLLDALDRAEVEADPDALTTPLGEPRERSESSAERVADKSMRDTEERCARCGTVRERSDMDLFDGQLGEVWVCSDREVCDS